MWVYHSPIGPFVIKRLQNGKYGLLYADEIWGQWSPPQAAADDVYTHTTGCYDWDKLDCQIEDVPTDLLEWERH